MYTNKGGLKTARLQNQPNKSKVFVNAQTCVPLSNVCGQQKEMNLFIPQLAAVVAFLNNDQEMLNSEIVILGDFRHCSPDFYQIRNFTWPTYVVQAKFR